MSQKMGGPDAPYRHTPEAKAEEADRAHRAVVFTSAAPVAQVASGEAWIVVKEHAWDQGDGGRPTLAYLWPAEFNREVFPSIEAARQFIRKPPGLPLGWVTMKIAAPAPVAQAVVGARRQALEDAIAACEGEALKEPQAGTEDIAYDYAVRDCANAIRAIITNEREATAVAPVAGVKL